MTRSATLNNDQFIEKANAIHNNKYDYSKLKYINTKHKVEIICKNHGSFFQMPLRHLKGNSCPSCLHFVYSHENFLLKANNVHNYKYEYPEKCINGYTKINILCKEHGIFMQSPGNHLLGRGCTKCSNIKKALTHEQFLEKIKTVHANKYDYSKAFYTLAKDKIEIICSIHGSFFQTANAHLGGHGCPKCADEYTASLLQKRTNTNEYFVNESNKIHNNKYEYIEKYVHGRIKIKIKCPIHGFFEQTGNKHLAGDGCPFCSKRFKKTTEEFINEANIIHNNKYTYVSEYIGAREYIDIKCKKHGIFKQTPGSHLRGSGCIKCCSNTSKIEQRWLDEIGIPNDSIHRGVTIKINGKKVRPDGYDPKTKIFYEFYGDYFHGNAKIYDLNKFNPTTKCTMGELYDKTIKRQELIKEAGYNLIFIWESDYKEELKSRGETQRSMYSK